ncbi:MAG TPA: sn-glycerol-3-phosphate import ATP-binding protein UgpC [Burkholderiales bacterium]|jgi:sn-glycerol 3-phosphate transport system ATP-binding protein|nr:sn-glycerol-3-phosphate import ATP-binding protein UgpC [Burkholderiales bacterium]
MAKLEIIGIRKLFGSHRALDDVNVVIEDGEFAVVVGPSGCGKTTLLRIIAGLETATGGLIQIGGRDVTTLEPKDRDIAMVFQNYALYPHMSVYRNMAYGLKMRRMSKAEIERRVRASAEILGLQDLLERKPGQLSGGQRQRVAMGRAIVREPKVFLFDEPLSNLDAQLRVQMRFEIQKLHTRVPTTSVYVTHDQVEAMTLADRVVVMNGGHVEQIGAPMEVYARPESLFVAGFIGSPAMNLVHGTINSGGTTLTLGDGTALPLPGPALAGWQGRDVVVGMRPEHLAWHDGATANIRLNAEIVEPLGADTLVHGTLGGAPFVVRLPGGQRVEMNETVPLDIDHQQLHFFDAQGGKRLDPAAAG